MPPRTSRPSSLRRVFALAVACALAGLVTFRAAPGSTAVPTATVVAPVRTGRRRLDTPPPGVGTGDSSGHDTVADDTLSESTEHAATIAPSRVRSAVLPTVSSNHGACGHATCPVEGVDGHDGDTAALRTPLRVVIGIPSVDTDFGAERRSFQRRSWLTYPEVWHPHRESHATAVERAGRRGVVLVRYILARHPAANYELRELLRDESRRERDIIALDTREGKPSTGKKPGQAGYWGLEAEVGMSRKAYAWYCLATRYSAADYVMKSDDDFFLRVRRYLADLAALPRVRLYWGPVMMWGARKNDPTSKFAFVGGMAVTMSRDLALWISTDARAAVNQGPFHGDKLRYKATNHDHEDVMVGRMFFDANVSHLVVRDCRFHDIHTGANVRKLTDASVGIHHLRHAAAEYEALFRRFVDADAVGASPQLLEAVRAKRRMRAGVFMAKVC